LEDKRLLSGFSKGAVLDKLLSRETGQFDLSRPPVTTPEGSKTSGSAIGSGVRSSAGMPSPVALVPKVETPTSVERTPGDDVPPPVVSDGSVPEEPSNVSEQAGAQPDAGDAGLSEASGGWSSVSALSALGPANAVPVVRSGVSGKATSADDSTAVLLDPPVANVEHTEIGQNSNGSPAAAPADAGDAAARPNRDRIVTSERPSIEETPSPRIADLLTQFLPVNRAALEKAIDQFLESFHGLGDELTDIRGPAGLLPAVTVVAMAALTREAALRWRRRRDNQPAAATHDDLADIGCFPWLSDSWSLAEI